MQQYYINLWKYDKWATVALLEKLEQQAPLNVHIYTLLSHNLSAQRIWLDRCKALPAREERFKFRDHATIKTDLEAYNAEWTAYLETLEDVAFDQVLHYQNIAGTPFENRLGDILTHVINHGTHHRGSVITLMKQEGYALPMLDYIGFVR